MKIRQKRVLAYVLAVVMVLNLCAVPARAEGESGNSDANAHNWTYARSDNNTITASCSDSGCVESVTIQLGNTDEIYDGKEHPAIIVATTVSGKNSTSITATKDSSVKTQLEDMGIKLAIQYQKKVTNDTYVNLGEGKSPTDAGTYKVIASVETSSSGSENTASVQNDGTPISIEKEFTIEKASITPAFQFGWTSEWTQGDTNIKLPELAECSNPGNGTVTYSVKKKSEPDTEYKELTETDLQNLDPGEYTIKAIVAASMNHSAGETATTLNFTVTAKKAIKVTVAMDGWIFESEANSPSTIIKAGNDDITTKYASGDFVYSYYTDADCTKETTKANGAAKDGEAPKNAGTYYVKVVVPVKDTYASGEDTAEFTIAKATIKPTIKTDWSTSWTQGDENIEFPEIEKNPENGEVTYYAKKREEDDTKYNKLTDVSKLRNLDAGDYTLKAKVAETDNYKDGEDTRDFTVTAKKAIKVTVAMDGWIFESEANSPSTIIKAGNDDITTKYASGDFVYSYYTDADCTKETTKANGAAKDGEAPKNAGTYYVKVVVPVKDTYASGEDTAEFTIAKATIKPTIKTDWSTSWTQGDENIEFPEIEKNPENGEVTYYAKKNEEGADYVKLTDVSELRNLEVGDYTLKAKVAETDNYQDGEDTCYFTVTAKKDNPSPSNNPLDPSPSPTKNPLLPSTPAPTQQTETPTPTATPIPEITINGKKVKNNQTFAVSIRNKITVSANAKIKLIPQGKTSQKKCLKVSVKNKQGTIKVNDYSAKKIKVVIKKGNKKIAIWIKTEIPTPKFTVKVNGAKNKFTLTIKNKAIAKKIGCYTVEAKNKNTKNKYVYIDTNKFKLIGAGGRKYPKGKYGFRITFWSTRKPVKNGKLLNKYKHQSSEFYLTVK